MQLDPASSPQNKMALLLLLFKPIWLCWLQHVSNISDDIKVNMWMRKECRAAGWTSPLCMFTCSWVEVPAVALCASWAWGSMSEDMIDDLCSVLKSSKLKQNGVQNVWLHQLKVRLMKCGKLFSSSFYILIYFTIRLLLNRVGALSRHDCDDWMVTGWSSVTDLIVAFRKFRM